MKPAVNVPSSRVSKVRFFLSYGSSVTFVFEGVGHIDNLQMREDTGGTQWNCTGFVYTRVRHALESGRNHSLL